MNNPKRWAAGTLLRMSGRPERNRRRLYNGAFGLRIVTFHDVPEGREFDAFTRIVSWCAERYDVAGPEAAAQASEGHLKTAGRDKLLVTFDDGHVDNFLAARWLAGRDIRAIFFVVPSYLGKTRDQYVAFHRDRGVRANTFGAYARRRVGLSLSQVKEMAAMGHLIGGHNFAHRDLGKLATSEQLDYEIGQSLDAVAQINGHACDDFAIGFGRARHVSAPAAEYLSRRCRRVYANVRGLNVSGVTPRYLLRNSVGVRYPAAFEKMAIAGGLDARVQSEWHQLRQLSGVLPADEPGTLP